MKPPSLNRRSPLYRWHDQQGASYEIDGRSCLVSVYSSAASEARQASELGLCDLSLLGRNGYKGGGARDWLARHCALPEQPNTAVQYASGGLVASLSQEELLVIDSLDPAANLTATLDAGFEKDRPSDVFPLPRADSHCMFAVSGRLAASMFAKLCGVDLQAGRFESGVVAQTSVARMNAIVVRGFVRTAPVYYLLSDASAAEYLWQCILDAMQEYSGTPVGVVALRSLGH